MKMDVLGIIFSNMYDHMMGDLTKHRCMGSIPVGGRYRLIDFSLSAFANAGIEDVGVVTKSNYQSLMDHLGTGREWDLTRKRGGLAILPPFGHVSSAGMYQNRIEALMGIMDYIRSNGSTYILGTDCDYVANFDYADFLQEHVDSGADISLMYRKTVVEGQELKEVTTFTLDGASDIVDMMIYPQITGTHNVYINAFLISRELLMRLITDRISHNLSSFNRDILQASVGKYKMHAYEFKGYAARFDSIQGYYNANMAFLSKDVRSSLFPQERPVYTKVRDEAPVRYGLNSLVKNSLAADGCIIEGEVENSVLFRGVVVEKGTKIKNSIVMQGTRVGAGSSLEYVITDKDVQIRDGHVLTGVATFPVYINKGIIV